MKEKTNENVEEYVRNVRKEGHSDAAIRYSLQEAGYTDDAINHALGGGKSSRDTRIVMIISIVFLAASVIIYTAVNIIPAMDEDIEDSAEPVVETPTSQLNDALLSGDQKGCEDINDTSVREACNDYFNPKEEACDGECRDRRIFNEALINGSSELCIPITDNYIKGLCQNMTEGES